MASELVKVGSIVTREGAQWRVAGIAVPGGELPTIVALVRVGSEPEEVVRVTEDQL